MSTVTGTRRATLPKGTNQPLAESWTFRQATAVSHGDSLKSPNATEIRAELSIGIVPEDETRFRITVREPFPQSVDVHVLPADLERFAAVILEAVAAARRDGVIPAGQ